MNSPKPEKVVIEVDKTPQSPPTSGKRSPNLAVQEDKTLASSPPATKRPASTTPSPFLRPRRRSNTGASGTATAFPIDLVVLSYANDGSAVSTHFEPRHPCFLFGLDQKGSKSVPSALFNLKETLPQYLAAQVAINPNGPHTMDQLAPRRQLADRFCTATTHPHKKRDVMITNTTYPHSTIMLLCPTFHSFHRNFAKPPAFRGRRLPALVGLPHTSPMEGRPLQWGRGIVSHPCCRVAAHSTFSGMEKA